MLRTFVVMLVVCQTPETVERQVVVAEANNGSKQKLVIGSQLVLHLDTTLGTGFRWTIAKHDKEQLKFVTRFLLNKGKDAPGGKSAQVYVFKAEKEGISDLELIYSRPFEKKEPAKRFKVVVTITKE